jgi:hypothetical protein
MVIIQYKYSYLLVIFQILSLALEFGNLLSIEDNYPKYVITMDEISAGMDQLSL